MRDFLNRWRFGWTAPQAWWRQFLARRLDRALPACMGGGCCSFCPHVLLAEAKESIRNNDVAFFARVGK
jgi:hypothetical protein